MQTIRDWMGWIRERNAAYKAGLPTRHLKHRQHLYWEKVRYQARKEGKHVANR